MSDELPGLAKGVVVLSDHDPRWADLFASEAARISSALGARVLGLEHYGSTAIPGIKAKPVIDLLVGVPRLNDVAKSSQSMTDLGYEDAGPDVVPGHHIFGLGAARTHIAHFVVFEGQRWRECLAFRDALRNDQQLARAYEALKMELAVKHPNDRAAYTEGKGAFVQRVVAKALNAF